MLPVSAVLGLGTVLSALGLRAILPRLGCAIAPAWSGALTAEAEGGSSLVCLCCGRQSTLPAAVSHEWEAELTEFTGESHVV